MLEKKRTVYDLLQEIVEACQEPIELTDLFYKVRTTYSVLTSKLNIAIRLGLVKNIDQKYHTTPKGKDFLDAWERVQTLLKEEQKIE